MRIASNQRLLTIGLIGTCALGVAAAALPALFTSSARAAEEPKAKADKKDVVDVAVADGHFKTLAAALGAAGLVETLKSEGPFTVFAPTDAAFEKLPAGTVEMLLKPENKEKLKAILAYHVVPGKAMAKDVAGMADAKTVNGKKVKFEAKDGKVMVNDSTVTKADIEASNGVIHVIDAVLMP